MSKIETIASNVSTELTDAKMKGELTADELDAVTGGQTFSFLGVVFHVTRNDNIYSSEVDTGRRLQK